jgi:hypothetical protein
MSGPSYSRGNTDVWMGDLLVRLAKDFVNCVVFFGVPTERAPIEYGGTGFLVGYAEEDRPNLPFPYLVTARHVAELLAKHDDTGFYIRANLKGSGSVNMHIQKANWQFHPDSSVDLAALRFSSPDVARLQTLTVSLLDKNIVDYTAEPKFVRPGDELSLVGLFRLHAGSQRNLPLVHSGNVALLPDPSELVPIRNRVTGEVVESEVYLIEAQTLDGLSGSPVFMHLMVPLVQLAKFEGERLRGYAGTMLLGVYTGSWDGEPGVILAADRNLHGGKRVPIGMGTAVPAKRIMELIRDNPDFKLSRRLRIKILDAANAASTDSSLAPIPQPEGATQAEPAKGEPNPNHKEAFTSLLNAASKKSQPSG